MQTWLNKTGHEENIHMHVLYGVLPGLSELASCMDFTVQAEMVESRNYMAIGTRARGLKAWLCISILKIEPCPQSAKNPIDPPHYSRCGQAEPTLLKCSSGFCLSPTGWPWKKASSHRVSAVRVKNEMGSRDCTVRDSLLRTGLASAEGMCSLQDPRLSLPQMQPGAQPTTTHPAHLHGPRSSTF